MISKKRWHIKDKWLRHLALARNPRVSRHLPPTRLLKRRSLRVYLGRYSEVFVKPVFGSFGNNILKVTKGNGVYLVHRERRVEQVEPERIAGRVLRHAGTNPYLIQKGIPLLRIGGRPVDFRLLLLKPGRRWQVMGIMGKIAAGNRIVTNYNHGGKPVGFKEALRRAGWNEARIRRTEQEMVRIGRAAARTFKSRYKHCRRLGIDYALDAAGRLWILEVNTNPYYDLFRFHENKRLYGRIDRYMKQIGKLQSDR